MNKHDRNDYAILYDICRIDEGTIPANQSTMSN